MRCVIGGAPLMRGVSRHRMRAVLLLMLFAFGPAVALAGVRWHEFGRSSSDKEKITVGRISLTFERQKDSRSSFPSDDLVVTVHSQGRESSEHWFTSAYGFGSVAIYRNMLLLKCGVGRGTYVREDHVKALRLDHNLDELADVQSSYYVLTNPHNAAPTLIEYSVTAKTEVGYTVLSFSLRKPQRGLPSEKIVRLKNDG